MGENASPDTPYYPVLKRDPSATDFPPQGVPLASDEEEAAEKTTIYSATVMPSAGYHRSDTGLIAHEVFSLRGVSQQYGPSTMYEITIDIARWGLKPGDVITLRTASAARGYLTERNGIWVDESNVACVNVGNCRDSGKEFAIHHVDERGKATKIKQPASEAGSCFYTDKGNH